MEARVVGGRVAARTSLIVVLAASLACDAPSFGAPTRQPEPAPPPPEKIEAPAPEPKAEAPAAEPRRLVLVTIDGVRWEDVFTGGGMPNLARFVRERGVAFGDPACPHPVRASGPNFVSLPGYTEIFTGRPSACTHNYCAPIAASTVVDEARAAAARDADVAVFASWGKYSNAVARQRGAITLSAGQNGQSGRYRHDVQTARIALGYLETVRPRLLVLGLGDADEEAHRGDIAAYRRAIRRSDEILGELVTTLDRVGDRETSILVTTDHGRANSLFAHGARFPESQRVFIAAFGAGIAARGFMCADQPLRLADIAGAVRPLLGLEGETSALAGELVRYDRPGP